MNVCIHCAHHKEVRSMSCWPETVNHVCCFGGQIDPVTGERTIRGLCSEFNDDGHCPDYAEPRGGLPPIEFKSGVRQ